MEVFGLTYPDTFIDLNEANANEGWERVIDQASCLLSTITPPEWPGFHYSLGFNVQTSTITRKGLTGKTSLSTFELLLTAATGSSRYFQGTLCHAIRSNRAPHGDKHAKLGGQVFEEP